MRQSVLIETFLNWLNDDPKNDNGAEVPEGGVVAAPTAVLQFMQRSLPSPQRLAEIADDYEARQQRTANEQYEAFVNTGYPNFVQWMESLVEKSAGFGGRLLLLTFDNCTGLVYAATPGPREILPPTSYALPISQPAVQRLAAMAADHFQKANFRVKLSRQEGSCSRLGTQSVPAYDCLDILWSETPAPYTADGARSYQTAPLPEYLAEFQTRARELFGRIKECVGESRVTSSKGSFSVVSSPGRHTVGKIIIFENGLGKTYGDLRDLSDGVYVLVRANGPIGDRIWNSGIAALSRMDRDRTIGMAPKHDEQFAYSLVSEANEDEEIACMLQDCVKAADSGHRMRKTTRQSVKRGLAA